MRSLLIILLLSFHILSAQEKAWERDAAPLHRAQKALTDIIVHDIFSPPVASRIYAYTNLAAYEVLVKKYPEYKSLTGQLQQLPELPAPATKITASLSAVYAFLLTGRNFVYSENVLQDSMNKILKWYRSKNISEKEYQASLEYGKQAAAMIIKWAGQDKYRETRSMRRYNFSKEAGKWIPTPPVYMAAIEPYWSRIRPLTMDSGAQFRSVPALSFSTDTASGFYREASEVYLAGMYATPEQKAVASFWDCNPFAVHTEGHLNFANKKISPGGHWMSIAGLACKKERAGIMRSAAVYTLTAVSIFDGFIICWDEKYRSNLIRPETYINKYIDEAWRPLLQTPPFPEYSSGHSVISTTAAEILTSLFGEPYDFDDDTEVEFGLPVRHFTSFRIACNEAAMSRLYGGIHYRSAVVNGQKQGRELGAYIVRKIKLASK